MSRRELNAAYLALALALDGNLAGAAAGDRPGSGFGRPLADGEPTGGVAIPPSGAGLPSGRGTVAQGRQVYRAKCAGCHGDELQGVKPTGGVALIGGRGTLASAKPVKTVESYWPYATTLYDYVKRAMPFDAPGSLSNDESYAVVAYILAEGHVISDAASLDATTLPKVRMPNATGFVPDPRPDQRP